MTDELTIALVAVDVPLIGGGLVNQKPMLE